MPEFKRGLLWVLAATSVVLGALAITSTPESERGIEPPRDTRLGERSSEPAPRAPSVVLDDDPQQRPVAVLRRESVDDPWALLPQDFRLGSQEEAQGSRTLHFVGPQGSGVSYARLAIGAPAFFPWMRFEADAQGKLELPRQPATRLDGGSYERYEILARSRSLGFWDSVDLESTPAETPTTLRLVPASPLEIEVSDEAGAVLIGARLRLSKGIVGLVQLVATSDGAGRARFSQIPPGDYVVSVRAAGRPTRELRLRHDVRAPMLHRVVLPHGQVVAGRVLDTKEQPIADARVELHHQRPGASVGPMPIVLAWGATRTDSAGRFVLTDVPLGRLRLRAEAPGFVPTLGAPRELRADGEPAEQTLVLERGVDIMVEVRASTTGDAIAGATVEARDEALSFVQRVTTEADGSAKLSGLARTVTVSASKQGWRSAQANLGPEVLAAGTPLVLRLEPPSRHSSWRMRFLRDPGVRPTALELDVGGERCRGIDQGDEVWLMQGCRPGQGVLRIRTASHGVAVREGSFADGQEIVLKPPATKTFEIKAPTGGERLRAMWSSGKGGWSEASLERDPATPARHTWRASLFEGSYVVELKSASLGERRVEIEVGPEGIEPPRVELEPRQRLALHVLDRRDGPVSGAWMQLWRGTTLVEEGTSLGRQASGFWLDVPFQGKLVVMHPRLGEAEMPIDLRAGERLRGTRRVILGDALWSSALAGRLRSSAEVIAVLGCSLHRDGAAWLADGIPASSLAARMGLKRGDALISVRRVGDYHVVLARRGDTWLTLEGR